jgi:hypothetical protein
MRIFFRACPRVSMHCDAVMQCEQALLIGSEWIQMPLTSAGLEPAIPGSVGRCLIHWATRPLSDSHQINRSKQFWWMHHTHRNVERCSALTVRFPQHVTVLLSAAHWAYVCLQNQWKKECQPCAASNMMHVHLGAVIQKHR